MLTRSGHSPGNLFAAVALLIGTAIGAGIFGIPYVVSQSGYSVGIIYIIALGLVSLLVNLAYGEVVLSTKGTHQFPAYIEKYLGKRWKIIGTSAMFIGLYGSLAAYILEVGNLLHGMLAPIFGGSAIIYATIFAIIMAVAILIGLQAVANLEKFMVVSLLTLIGILAIIGLQYITPTYYADFNASALFLPYGVILFAFGAASAIPDMKNILRDNLQMMRKAVILGSLIPLLLYIVFVTIVIGITGPDTTESTVAGLGVVMGQSAQIFGSIFGILAMTTSFLAVALVLKEVFQYDFTFHPLLAWAIVMIPPYVVVLFGFLSFIEILGISGALIGGVNGIIIMHMHRAASKQQGRPAEYSITQSRVMHIIVYGIFILGMLYEAYVVLNKFSLL